MKKANKYINIRLVLICAALSLAIISVVTKLVLLSISDGIFLQNEGKKRYIKYREIKSVRGGIYDRNNFPLAISIVNYDLYALSGLTINELKKVNVALSNEINLDKNFLFKKKTLLKKNITPKEHVALKELNLNRLEVEVRHSRHYPLGDQIAPLVGFYGKDGAQEGLEMSYDFLLDGTNGREKLYKNAKQEIISKPIEIINKVPGKDIILTIDSTIQFYAYKYLAEAVKNNNAKSGSVIVLDNKKGEILAIASYPSYNPNDPMRSIQKNRALVDAYEFGSAIKPILLSFAIDEEVIDFDEEISTPQRFEIEKKIISDPKNYQSLKPMDIIAYSSQVGATKVALKTGYDSIKKNYLNFGFSKPISINFPSSSLGYFNFKDSVSERELAALGYGYGFEVSPYQLASAYSVFANGGVLKDFVIIKNEPVISQQVISKESADYILQSLEAVVEYGTGKLAGLKNFDTGGKTSTVHKVSMSGYKDDAYRASFVGIAPADEKSLTIMVSIDNPSLNSYSGGAVAAPVFAKIADSTLNYLGY